MTQPIRYTLSPAAEPAAHLFHVSCRVAQPDDRPALRPARVDSGNYLIRDFARHIVAIPRRSRRQPVPLTKLDKHTWQAAPVGANRLTCTTRVYAWDLSVRGAHLDRTRLLQQHQRLPARHRPGAQPCLLDPAARRPRMRRLARGDGAAAGGRKDKGKRGFGRYRAIDYDELIDHPVEMGTFAGALQGLRHPPHDDRHQRPPRLRRRALGLDGRPEEDLRMADRFFGDRQAPMDRYVFLVMARRR